MQEYKKQHVCDVYQTQRASSGVVILTQSSLNVSSCFSDAGGKHRPRSNHPGHRRLQRQQDSNGRHVLPAYYGDIIKQVNMSLIRIICTTAVICVCVLLGGEDEQQ